GRLDRQGGGRAGGRERPRGPPDGDGAADRDGHRPFHRAGRAADPRQDRRHCAGVAGLVVLIGPSALAGVGGHIAAELAILAATVCYAASALAGRGLPPLPADAVSAGMLLAAAPLGLALASLPAPPGRFSPSPES